MTSESYEEYNPNPHGKIIKVECHGSTDYTTTLTLAEYGITNIRGVTGFIASASVGTVLQNNPTTAISGGILTLTWSTAQAMVKGAAAVTATDYVAFIYGDTVY